jgi:hypothetical protein
MKRWFRNMPSNGWLMAAVALALAVLIAWGKTLQR